MILGQEDPYRKLGLLPIPPAQDNTQKMFTLFATLGFVMLATGLVVAALLNNTRKEALCEKITFWLGIVLAVVGIGMCGYALYLGL